MFENQGVGDNHNAPVFLWCYKRMGEFIPQLVGEGKEPRIMLEYSGTLLHGLRKQGANDVFDSLRGITCNPDYRRCVEWLGAPWGHAVAPSTPVQDYRLHVKAWQHHFAAIFGFEALSRVRGFSPSEMALPNHPDVAYEFAKTLKDCGYQWVLVQEHTVEEPADGWHPRRPHLPHRLVCTNSKGETASIIALIKTQGSDTKLVAQMQPAYEARSLGRIQLAGRAVPPLVTQIAVGENGGVIERRGSDHMDLVLLNRQGLEFVIVLDDPSGASGGTCGMLGIKPGPLTPPGAVAVRQLRYRGYSLGVAFRTLFAAHRSEQGQIVTFDGEIATPQLEVADGAMPVQHEWRRFPTLAACPDSVDDLARLGDVLPDLQGSVASHRHRSVFRCQANPGDLRQCERTETHEQAVGKVRLVPG